MTTRDELDTLIANAISGYVDQEVAVQKSADQETIDSLNGQLATAHDNEEALQGQIDDLQSKLNLPADQALYSSVETWIETRKSVAGNEDVRQALLTWVSAKGLDIPPAPTLRFPGDPTEGNLYWGSSLDGTNINDWVTFSNESGGLGACRRYYTSNDGNGQFSQNISDNNLSSFKSEASAIRGAGGLSVSSFKVPNNDWAGVASGQYDAWLHDLSAAVASHGEPVFVCLHHEPNGNGNAADFRAMYSHAAPILKQANNLVLMPIHNGWLFVDDSGWQQWMVEESDVDGIDIYPRKMQNKSDLVAKYQKGLDNLASGGKPMFLAEFGARDLVQGDYAAQMIRDLYDYLIARGDVVGCTYFNSSKNVNVFPEAGPYILTGARLYKFRECAGLPTSAIYGS